MGTNKGGGHNGKVRKAGGRVPEEPQAGYQNDHRKPEEEGSQKSYRLCPREPDEGRGLTGSCTAKVLCMSRAILGELPE
jgi:hypothetical protein